jgi:hypothetical protein
LFQLRELYAIAQEEPKRTAINLQYMDGEKKEDRAKSYKVVISSNLGSPHPVYITNRAFR